MGPFLARGRSQKISFSILVALINSRGCWSLYACAPFNPLKMATQTKTQTRRSARYPILKSNWYRLDLVRIAAFYKYFLKNLAKPFARVSPRFVRTNVIREAKEKRRRQLSQTPTIAKMNNMAKERRLPLTDISLIMTFKHVDP